MQSGKMIRIDTERRQPSARQGIDPSLTAFRKKKQLC